MRNAQVAERASTHQIKSIPVSVEGPGGRAEWGLLYVAVFAGGAWNARAGTGPAARWCQHQSEQLLEAQVNCLLSP